MRCSPMTGTASSSGYYNQYKFEPITSAWGPCPHLGPRRWSSENSAFHIVGTQFDTVFKEGSYLVRKGNAEKGACRPWICSPRKAGSSSSSSPRTAPTQCHPQFSNASRAHSPSGIGEIPSSCRSLD